MSKVENTERKPVQSQQRNIDESLGDILRRVGLGRTKETQALDLAGGGYQVTAHGQLDALMQSDQPEHIRYYAWLLRHSLGYITVPHSVNKKLGTLRYHGRCAMKLRRGKKVPATQLDAATDLFLSKQRINRAQTTLE